MTTTFVEIARWHAHQAKTTTGAERDFHVNAAKLLRDLAKRRSEQTSPAPSLPSPVYVHA
jgi:hypothetical protein